MEKNYTVCSLRTSQSDSTLSARLRGFISVSSRCTTVKCTSQSFGKSRFAIELERLAVSVPKNCASGLNDSMD